MGNATDASDPERRDPATTPAPAARKPGSGGRCSRSGSCGPTSTDSLTRLTRHVRSEEPVRPRGLKGLVPRTPPGLCEHKEHVRRKACATPFRPFFFLNCLLASPFHLFIPWLKLHPSSRSLCRPGLGVHIPRYSLLPPPPPLGRSLFLPWGSAHHRLLSYAPQG